MASRDSNHESEPDTGSTGDDEQYKLKAEQFPKRLELELPPHVLTALEALSASTGRSIGEIAEELISRAAFTQENDEQMQ